MPHDPARVAEARSWFAKAAADLRAGQVALRAKPPLLAHAVFDAQQAVEKSMKGFLAWHDRPFRKTHNLVELGETCVAIEARLSEVLRSAAPLTEYAWRFRYPGDPSEPSPQESEEALETARAAHEAILQRLPAELHP
jgi:HEPN domain-containing protein